MIGLEPITVRPRPREASLGGAHVSAQRSVKADAVERLANQRRGAGHAADGDQTRHQRRVGAEQVVEQCAVEIDIDVDPSRGEGTGGSDLHGPGNLVELGAARGCGPSDATSLRRTTTRGSGLR